jgi:hypothetical protein
VPQASHASSERTSLAEGTDFTKSGPSYQATGGAPQKLQTGFTRIKASRSQKGGRRGARRFNRTENVRPIPPSDPDFARLYARRNDAESINRNLEDTLFLGRAHSVGRLRQQVDLIGYALLVNGLTVLRHERRGRLPTAA